MVSCLSTFRDILENKTHFLRRDCSSSVHACLKEFQGHGWCFACFVCCCYDPTGDRVMRETKVCGLLETGSWDGFVKRTVMIQRSLYKLLEILQKLIRATSMKINVYVGFLKLLSRESSTRWQAMQAHTCSAQDQRLVELHFPANKKGITYPTRCSTCRLESFHGHIPFDLARARMYVSSSSSHDRHLSSL